MNLCSPSLLYVTGQKEESCTRASPETVTRASNSLGKSLRQVPGQARKWSEVRVGIREEWDQAQLELHHKGESQPEEPWLKAALELNRGEMTLSLTLSVHWPWTTCSTPGVEGNALQAPMLWISQNPFVFTCQNLSLIIWCISNKSETDFTGGFLDYMKAIPYAKIIPLH